MFYMFQLSVIAIFLSISLLVWYNCSLGAIHSHTMLYVCLSYHNSICCLLVLHIIYLYYVCCLFYFFVLYSNRTLLFTFFSSFPFLSLHLFNLLGKRCWYIFNIISTGNKIQYSHITCWVPLPSLMKKQKTSKCADKTWYWWSNGSHHFMISSCIKKLSLSNFLYLIIFIHMLFYLNKYDTIFLILLVIQTQSQKATSNKFRKTKKGKVLMFLFFK